MKKNIIIPIVAALMSVVFAVGIAVGLNKNDRVPEFMPGKAIVEEQADDLIKLSEFGKSPFLAIKINYPNSEAKVNARTYKGGLHYPYMSALYKELLGFNVNEEIDWRKRIREYADVEQDYIDIIIELENNVVGYAVIEINKEGVDDDEDIFSARIVKAVVFPKIEEEYQYISIFYLMDKLAEAKNWR